MQRQEWISGRFRRQRVEEAISQPYFTVLSRLGRTIAVKKKGDKYLKSFMIRATIK